VRRAKTLNRFYLLSMSGSSTRQIFYGAVIEYAGWLVNKTNVTLTCAGLFNNPGMTWCPLHLQDECQLTNYYSQIAFHQAVINASYGMPHAIYIDAVDFNGTIRTGTTLFGPGYPEGWVPQQHGTTGFSYVAAMLLVNVRRACTQQPLLNRSACNDTMTLLLQKYSTNPVQRWNDTAHGRHEFWPPGY
jgi:hypothetical protein